MTDLNQLLETARLAARAAGEPIRAAYGNPQGVRYKGRRDLVTETDEQAQEAALNVIAQRHPGHPVLAEEAPSFQPDENGVWPMPDGVLWIVDPLDGTSNFTTSLPFSSVSVGVSLDGEPVVGVVYDPYRDELFEATRGGGAFRDGERLGPLSPLPLERAIFALDWARAPATRKSVVNTLVEIVPRCHTVRSFGSAALGLSYVAAGRFGTYLNFGLLPWDLCAGAVIVREAGGVLVHPNGDPWVLGYPAVIAGHQSVVTEILPLVR